MVIIYILISNIIILFLCK